MQDAPSPVTNLARSRPRVEVLDLGTMDYLQCLKLQEDLHARVLSDPSLQFLIIVEHPPVLTFGKHADKSHLLFAAPYFQARGVAWVDVDRGGEVTAHVPGQIVAYPILRLADFELSPRRYITLLEAAVIRTVGRYGVPAATDAEHPGVWVGENKICAVGVRIKNRVTMHGLALNIGGSLELFQAIVPCGIVGRGVTSLNACTAKAYTTAELVPQLVAELRCGLGFEESDQHCRS